MRECLSVASRTEPDEIGRARAAVDRFCERAGVTGDLHARVRLAVTEAVTNCVLYAYDRDRRAGVPRVTLEARIDGDELVVLVRDEGVGVRALQAGVQRGLGLRLIDHVADAAYISSVPGRGTRVGMRFPLDARDDPPAGCVDDAWSELELATRQLR